MARSYSKRPFFERFEFDTNGGCWLWSGAISSNGYGHGLVDGRDTTAHRAFFERFNGPLSPGMEPCHRCDVRPCVNPDHIYAGTRSRNIQDSYDRGRRVGVSSPGSTNPNAKLTEDQVLAIRADRRKASVLAAEYGVSPYAIKRVRSARGWKHLRPTPPSAAPTEI